MAYTGPKTRAELDEQLAMLAKMGTDPTSVIQAFNAYAQGLAENERNRLATRERFIAEERKKRFDAYLEQLKNDLAEEAAFDFDEANPPVDVPALVSLDPKERGAAA